MHISENLAADPNWPKVEHCSPSSLDKWWQWTRWVVRATMDRKNGVNLETVLPVRHVSPAGRSKRHCIYIYIYAEYIIHHPAAATEYTPTVLSSETAMRLVAWTRVTRSTFCHVAGVAYRLVRISPTLEMYSPNLKLSIQTVGRLVS